MPSLSRLVRAYIVKAPGAIVEQNLLMAILGIFQRLITRQSTDHEGFTILAVLATSMPP